MFRKKGLPSMPEQMAQAERKFEREQNASIYDAQRVLSELEEVVEPTAKNILNTLDKLSPKERQSFLAAALSHVIVQAFFAAERSETMLKQARSLRWHSVHNLGRGEIMHYSPGDLERVVVEDALRVMGQSLGLPDKAA